MDPTVHLIPSVGKRSNFPKSRSLLTTWSPRTADIAIAVVPKAGNRDAKPKGNGKGRGQSKSEIGVSKAPKNNLWTVSVEGVPWELREFCTQTYIAFAFLQQQAALVPRDESGFGIISASTMEIYRRVFELYIEKLGVPDGSRPATKALMGTFMVILRLVLVLYLPPSGQKVGLVGEELLDWANTVDVGPTTAEGHELHQSKTFWTEPGFWEYLQRCILRGYPDPPKHFLTRLSTEHTSSGLKQLIRTHMLPLQQSCPRSSEFDREIDFEGSRDAWRLRLRNGREELDGLIRGMKRKELWVEPIRGIFEIWAGNETMILNMAKNGSGWREALGAWGIWVLPSMRRDDIPEVVDAILEEIPADTTLPEESLQVELALGHPILVVQQATIYNPWLGVHILDLFEKLDLIAEEEIDTPLDQRSFWVLNYAEYLLADPVMWRIAFGYASTCGEAGSAWIEQNIRHVALQIRNDESENDAKTPYAGVDAAFQSIDQALELMPHTDEEQMGGAFKTVYRLLKICEENQLENALRSICEVASETLARQRRYGESVSFAIRARDPKRIRWIAERLLNEYIEHDADTFINSVAKLPSHLLQQPGDDEFDQEMVVYASHLTFPARFRDFLLLYAEGRLTEAANQLVALLITGTAPKKWWAVLLVDACPLLEDKSVIIDAEDVYELLRCLEEIWTRSSQGSADDYLETLMRLMKGPVNANGPDKRKRQADALGQLEIVRLALARQLARCSVIRAR